MLIHVAHRPSVIFGLVWWVSACEISEGQIRVITRTAASVFFLFISCIFVVNCPGLSRPVTEKFALKLFTMLLQGPLYRRVSSNIIIQYFIHLLQTCIIFLLQKGFRILVADSLSQHSLSLNLFPYSGRLFHARKKSLTGLEQHEDEYMMTGLL